MLANWDFVMKNMDLSKARWVDKPTCKRPPIPIGENVYLQNNMTFTSKCNRDIAVVTERLIKMDTFWL